MVGRECLLDAIVDPLEKLLVLILSLRTVVRWTYETDEASNLPAKLVDPDKAASDSRGRNFANVDGYNRGAGTNTDSGENATS